MIIVKMVLTGIFLLVIDITDIKDFKIKNKVILPFAVAGTVLGIINRSPLDSVFGLLFPLILFPLFALKMLGAGDVKALCAIGAVVGLKMSIITLIFTFLSGGIIAIVVMIANANFISRIKYLFDYIKMCIITKSIGKYNFGGDKCSRFRFAYAITAGTILAFLNEYIHIVTI